MIQVSKRWLASTLLVMHPAASVAATPEEASGAYRASDGSVIGLFPPPEDPSLIAMVDVESGIVRALFPDRKDRFTFGPALLTPEPAEGSIELRRDDAGSIVDLVRGAEPSVAYSRLDLHREDVSFENGSQHLAGTIIFPEGPGPHPALVMLHGSEPETRAGSLGLAQLFASQGVAALIFDKRGTGQSSGEEWRAPFEDYAGDAIAGFERLANHHRIDRDRVGYWGHSQGAWVSALAASRTPEAAFCILECGGAVDVVETTQWWGRRLFEAKTALTPEQIEEALVYRRIKYELVGGLATRDEYERATELVRDKPWFKHVTERLPDGFFGQATIRYNPNEALARLNHCPVLAIFAQHDAYTPTRASIATLEASMRQAAHPDFTIREIKNANHGLFETTTGARLEDEFEKTERFVPGYFSLLSQWTRRVAELD